MRIWSSQSNLEKGVGREDGMGRGSLEPAVAKCKFCSVLGMLVCVCKNCEKKAAFCISLKFRKIIITLVR